MIDLPNVSDYTDLFPPVQEEDQDSSSTAEVVILIILCIIGLAGNIFGLAWVLGNRRYRISSTHWYILQLMFVNILLFIAIPFRISEKLMRSWIYPEWTCKANEAIFYINFYITMLLLVAMSIERFTAARNISSPTRLQAGRKSNFVVILSLLLWIVSIAFSIPIILFTFKQGESPNCNCLPDVTIPKNQPQSMLNAAICEQLSTDIETINNCMEHLFNKELSESRCKAGMMVGSEDEGSAYFELPDNFFEAFGQISTNTDYKNELTDRGMISPNLTTTETLKKATGFKGNFVNDTGPSTIDSDFGIFFENSGGHNFGSGSGEPTSANESDYVPVVASDSRKSVGESDSNAVKNTCHFINHSKEWLAYLVFNFVVMYILPFFLMAVLYTLTIRLLSEEKSKMQNESSKEANSESGETKKQLQNNFKALSAETQPTLAFGIISIVAFVCWILFHSVNMAKLDEIENVSSQFCRGLESAGKILTLISAASTPFIYVCVGTNLCRRSR